MMQTMILKSNNTIKDIKPDNKKKFGLDELQAAVNGMVKMIELPDAGVYMCTNEEGVMLDLPYNARASMIHEKEFGWDTGKILGDVLIAQLDEID